MYSSFSICTVRGNEGEIRVFLILHYNNSMLCKNPREMFVACHLSSARRAKIKEKCFFLVCCLRVIVKIKKTNLSLPFAYLRVVRNLYIFRFKSLRSTKINNKFKCVTLSSLFNCTSVFLVLNLRFGRKSKENQLYSLFYVCATRGKQRKFYIRWREVAVLLTLHLCVVRVKDNDKCRVSLFFIRAFGENQPGIDD